MAEESYVPNPELTKGQQILSEAFKGNQTKKFIYPSFGISIQTPQSRQWQNVLSMEQLASQFPHYFLREPLTEEERRTVARSLISEASRLEGITLLSSWHKTQEADQRLAIYKILIEEFGEQEAIGLLEQEKTKNYQEHGKRLNAQSQMGQSPGINLSDTETRYPGGTRKIQRYK